MTVVTATSVLGQKGGRCSSTFGCPPAPCEDPLHGGRLSEQSFKPSIFIFLPKFSLYIEQGKGLSFAWLNFGLFFTLTFWNLCNLIKTTNYVYGLVNLGAELLIGIDSLLTDQEMNTELTTQHETRNLQVFHLFIGRPPTTHELGVRSLPGGRSPGGKGDFRVEVFEGQNQLQEPRRYPVNTLNQYSNVILSRK